MPPTPETRGGREKMGSASPSLRVCTAELPGLPQHSLSFRTIVSVLSAPPAWPAVQEGPSQAGPRQGGLWGQAAAESGGHLPAPGQAASAWPASWTLAQSCPGQGRVGTHVGFQDAHSQSARTSRCTRAFQALVTLL